MRKLSRVSAALLAAHAALLAMYFSVGMVIGILDPPFFLSLGRILIASSVITLAVFCLSTQIYLSTKDADES